MTTERQGSIKRHNLNRRLKELLHKNLFLSQLFALKKGMVM